MIVSMTYMCSVLCSEEESIMVVGNSQSETNVLRLCSTVQVLAGDCFNSKEKKEIAKSAMLTNNFRKTHANFLKSRIAVLFYLATKTRIHHAPNIDQLAVEKLLSKCDEKMQQTISESRKMHLELFEKIKAPLSNPMTTEVRMYFNCLNNERTKYENRNKELIMLATDRDYNIDRFKELYLEYFAELDEAYKIYKKEVSKDLKTIKEAIDEFIETRGLNCRDNFHEVLGLEINLD